MNGDIGGDSGDNGDVGDVGDVGGVGDVGDGTPIGTSSSGLQSMDLSALQGSSFTPFFQSVSTTTFQTIDPAALQCFDPATAQSIDASAQPVGTQSAAQTTNSSIQPSTTFYLSSQPPDTETTRPHSDFYEGPGPLTDTTGGTNLPSAPSGGSPPPSNPAPIAGMQDTPASNVTATPPTPSTPSSDLYEGNEQATDSQGGVNLPKVPGGDVAPPSNLSPIAGMQYGPSISVNPVPPPQAPVDSSGPAIGGTAGAAPATQDQNSGGGISVQPGNASGPPTTVTNVDVTAFTVYLEATSTAVHVVEIAAGETAIGAVAEVVSTVLAPVAAWVGSAWELYESSIPSEQVDWAKEVLDRNSVPYTTNDDGTPSLTGTPWANLGRSGQ